MTSRSALRWIAVALLPLLLVRSAPATPAAMSCERLVAVTFPQGKVTFAAETPAGPFTPPGAPASFAPLTVPAFCRVVAVSTPTRDSTINFEVWIPTAAAWNGRFQGVGNGAFEGSIGYAAMADALRRGYATASTDTGHSGGDLRFGQGHSEKIVDWAYRSIHLMTGAAKTIVRNHAGRFPERSYFTGCATGGQQALSEAQRFPADSDGIVAGNPAADRTNEILYYLWAWMATHRDDGTTIVPPGKLRLITRKAVDACDALDGVTDVSSTIHGVAGSIRRRCCAVARTGPQSLTGTAVRMRRHV
jgi:feruloyl esterase